MKKLLAITLCLFSCSYLLAQNVESIESETLNSNCDICIKVPKNYNESGDTTYPLILVLDGDYLFKPVVGQIDLQSYFDVYSKSIIVGINSNIAYFQTLKEEMSSLSDSDFQDKFRAFIINELLPHLDNELRINDFKVLVSHGKSSNLLNSFLLEKELVFNAYVNLSPDSSEDLNQNVIERLDELDQDIIYYVSTSTEASENSEKSFSSIIDQLKKVENRNFRFYFDDFNNATNHTQVTRGMAKAFEKVFNQNKLERNKKEKVLSYQNTLD